MPNEQALGEPERPAPRTARDEAQLMLGQIHGVVWLAVNEVDTWLPKGETTEGGESELTADDVRRAGAEVHGHFGVVQAALNSGSFDEELVKVGITGAQGQAKKRDSCGRSRVSLRPNAERRKTTSHASESACGGAVP
jgi:hypothetical protein